MFLKDPDSTYNCSVRRLAAIEGHEMVSTNEEEEPLILERDQCRVLADDKKLNPKVSYTCRLVVRNNCQCLSRISTYKILNAYTVEGE